MSGVLCDWWSSFVNDGVVGGGGGGGGGGGAAAGSFGPKNSTDYINISQAVLRLLGHK